MESLTAWARRAERSADAAFAGLAPVDSLSGAGSAAVAGPDADSDSDAEAPGRGLGEGLVFGFHEGLEAAAARLAAAAERSMGRGDAGAPEQLVRVRALAPSEKSSAPG